VYISKPYHTTAAILGLRVKTQPCGVVTAHASATLNLIPDAPAVRQVVLPKTTYNYDAGLSEHLTASVEAAEGVSHAVTWYSRDRSVARISTDGTLTAVCRRTRGKTWIVAASVIAPAVKDSIRIEVWPGDQPACR
jgi:YD repeat-containing protein